MSTRPRDIAYDDEWWPEPSPMSGSLHSVSGDPPESAPFILVPDGKGDYREHTVSVKPKARMGFR